MFTSWEPDLWGTILGTGFMRFESTCRIDGLAKVDGDRLELLAVHSPLRGQGNFRQFVKLAKSQFREIRVLHISRDWLSDALARYGFINFALQDERGEMITGMIWSEPKAEIESAT